MFKPGGALIFLSIGHLLLAEPSFAAVRCVAGPIINDQVDLQIGNRHIALIGWGHLDDTSGDTLINGLKAAKAEASAGHCDQAAKIAQNTLITLKSDLQSAQDVIAREIQLHLRSPLDSVGLEMTPNEYDEQLRLNVRIDDAFAKLNQACGRNLKPYADQLRLMAPGPEFEFVRMYPNVSLAALEDQTLKDANEKDFDGEQSDTFDYSNPAFTTESKAAIESIRRDLMLQVKPSETDIARAIAFERDATARAKLEADLRFSITRGTRIIAGAYKRNVAIAANILSMPGNMAIPIGFRHVNHLVGEILRQCQAR